MSQAGYDRYWIGSDTGHCQIYEEHTCAYAVEAAEVEKSLFLGGTNLKKLPADLVDMNYLGKVKAPYNCHKDRPVGKVKAAASMLDKQIVDEVKALGSGFRSQMAYRGMSGEGLLGNSSVDTAMEPENMTDAQVAHKEKGPEKEAHAEAVRKVTKP